MVPGARRAQTGTAATNRAPPLCPEQLEQKILHQVTSVLCSAIRAAEETAAEPLCPQLSSRQPGMREELVVQTLRGDRAVQEDSLSHHPYSSITTKPWPWPRPHCTGTM